ncbi:MAG: GAF domain-containing protein, partial [Chloroflexota bacterium]
MKTASPEPRSARFLSFLDNDALRLYLLIGLTVAIDLFFGALFLSQYIQARQPVMLVGALFILAAALFAGSAVLQLRAQRATRAGFLAITAVALTFISLPLFFQNISLVWGLAGFLLILFLSLENLPPRQALFGVLFGLVTITIISLVTLYPPLVKTPIVRMARAITTLSWVLIGVVLLALLAAFRRLPLAGKLMVAFTAVSLVVTAIFGYQSQVLTAGILRDNVGAAVRTEATSQALAVGDLLLSQAESLQALGVGELLQRWVKASNNTYPAEAQAVQGQLNELDTRWRRLVDTGGLSDALIRTRINNDISLDLTEYAQIFTNNAELILTDRYGALIAANRITSDYNQSDEFWWRAAYNQGQGRLYISKPAYDDSLQADASIIAIPVRDRDSGAVIGILRTTYLLTGLSEQLFSGAAEQQLDADLYFPGDTTQYMHAGGMEVATREALDRLGVLRTLDYAEIEYQGAASLTAYAPVVASNDSQDIADLGWYVVVHQDADIALAPVNAQTESNLALTGIVLGLVSLLAVVVAQVFATPIARLTETADQVRSGNLDAQAAVRSNDEIGRLAATFNDMTQRLRQTLGGLEQRIHERTRELTLAGSVGRTLSQERDLDGLLRLSAELIRSSFDLYYTQIYLTDASRRALVLRAGSGSVGVELFRRGHRLAIGSGSLNGEAAASRRPVIVSDTAASARFRPNPLLPETRSEMCVPLLVGDQVVGVLDMQSKRAGYLAEDKLPAFQALAGQLAVAVDNANLFAETQAARREVERQARRSALAAWDAYLDGVARPERIGFVADSASVRPLAEVEPPSPAPLNAPTVPAPVRVEAPILVAGAPVGRIQLERPAGQAWSEEDAGLVASVAQQ